MAEKTKNEISNNNEKSGKKSKKITGELKKFVIKHKYISLIILATIVIIILSISDYETKKQNSKENPNDPKNGPAAANGFINDVYIDENGVLRTKKSVRELWNELKQKGNAITKYLDSPEELAKLFSASMATDYPDTRRPEVNGESPDDPIDWSKYDIGIDSTEVQGIVKFKRALASNKTITMTYLPPSEFQEKIDKYNNTGKTEDRDEAMKYFTMERTVETSSTTGGGYVDISSRSLNNDPLEASDDVVKIHKNTNNLFNGKFDAVQSVSFDGKYIICSANAGKHGHHGGRVFWIDIQTGNVLPNYVTIGAEGNHMTGQTYDCDRKVVLVTSVGNKRLIQIDNQTKQIMSTRYVNIPHYFHVITYSPTTKQLIGYHNKKLTFMTYDPNENKYKEDETVPLSGSFNFPLQGMSTDGQVIYFLDSTNYSSKKDKFRVWVYDFKGNLIEEHKIGDSFPTTGSEVEDCFCDKEGNLWLVMPYNATKVANYKAFPIDWENGSSAVPISSSSSDSSGSLNSNSKVEEILKYACSWVGKLGYKSGAIGELKEGGKTECGGFVLQVYKKFGIMDHYVSPKKWVNGAPGTEEIGNDLSKASPGDITWRRGSNGRCHVSIYLGNGKRIHSTPSGVNIADVSNSAVHKIFHFTALPKDPGAYFDPKTGVLHSSNNSTSTSNTSTTSAPSTETNTNSSSSSSSSSSISGQAIVDEAEKYVGKLPYVWGGYSLETGADCSGFCWAILHKLGLYSGGHIWTVPFETKGEEVSSLAQAQAGDMIIYGPAKGQSTHMAIYDGNGGLIHEINESLGCKHYGTAATWGNIVTIRRFTNSSSTASARTYNNNVFNTEESTKIYSQQNMAVKEGSDRTYRAVQSACYDGKYAICAQNKNYGSVKASSKGGRIAWFNMETGQYETSIEIGAEGGHMDGVAYDSDRNIVLKPVRSSKGNLLQIDNNTKEIVGYTNMSKYCNKLTYVSTIHQLVGLDGGKLYFMTYNEEQKKYVKEEKEVKLENYHTNCGAQGIGTDGQCIYIADSGPDDSSSDYRVWTYTLDGKKVEEHKIGKVHTGSTEVESAFGDNNGNLWLVLPRGVEKVMNYTAGSSGVNQSSSNNNNNNNTSQGSFKVKVATWEESSEKVESTDSSEDKKERNYNMNAKTIPYQDIVAQYRMPFNYLWTMLLYSNNDKNYVFDLADQVRNSQIEITIHDNLQDTTTVVTESHLEKNHYEGEADVVFDYTNKIIIGDLTPQIPFAQEPQSMTISKGSIKQHGKGTADSSESYKKTTTTRNKVNTLDVSLTLADTWCVKFEKKYEYDGTKKDSSNSSTTYDDIVSEDTVSPISNSTLLNNVINDAQNNAIKALIDQGKTASIDSKEVLSSTEDITTTITDRKSSTKTDTITKKYTAKPEKFYTEETPKFAMVFNRHYNARSNILSAKAWFFEALESNADTANMVDLTKYLMYKATGTSYGVTTYNFKVYNPTDFTEISGGTLQGNSTEERVWLALINAGFNDVAAAAAMGNLSYESGGSGAKTINTDVVEGGYTETNGGIGMCQWTNNNRGTEGRNTQLRKYAQSKGKTWKDEETQIEFLITEITGQGKAKGYASYQFMTKTYGGVTYSSDSLKNVENNQSKIDYATKAFAATFERPAESAFSASMQKRVELANYFYTQYKGKRSSESSFGPSSAYANKSPEEKAKYLYPNGKPTTKEQAESYLTTIEVPITNKDGTKSTKSIQLHKAIAQDVYNACLAAQNAGFKIYEIGSYRAFGSDTAGATGGLSYSQHCYGLAVDINVNENCYIGYNGAVGPGSFWKPNENEYSIQPDGVLVKTFKSMGWGWGGEWSSPKDYMHFSFMGT